MSQLAHLWKVAIGEPGTNTPLREWWYVIAPDITEAHNAAEKWMEDVGWRDESPMDRILAIEFISDFIYSNADVLRFGYRLECADSKEPAET